MRRTVALALAVLLLGVSASADAGRASVRTATGRSDASVPLQPTRVLRLNNGHTLAALAAAGGHVAVTRTDGCSPIIIWDPRSGRVLRVSSGFPPRDLALGECVDLTGPLGPVWLALDRKQALLSIEYPIPFSGDQTAISVMQAPLDPPGPASTLVEEGYTGDQGGTAVAAAFADGRNVAVQTEDAYSHRHPSVLVYQSPSSKPTTISGRALGLADGRLLVRDTSGLSVVRVDGKRLCGAPPVGDRGQSTVAPSSSPGTVRWTLTTPRRGVVWQVGRSARQSKARGWSVSLAGSRCSRRTNDCSSCD